VSIPLPADFVECVHRYCGFGVAQSSAGTLVRMKGRGPTTLFRFAKAATSIARACSSVKLSRPSVILDLSYEANPVGLSSQHEDCGGQLYFVFQRRHVVRLSACSSVALGR
jgi:hypothetical protein